MGKYTAAVQDHLILPARVLQTRGHEQLERMMGRPIPAAVPVRLLIDTGSKRTTLIPEVIVQLRPAIRGNARVETSLAAVGTSLYWVRLEFPDTSLEPIPEVTVARMPLPASLRAFHGLIGRDLLHRWESFHFQGRRGRFTIRDRRGGIFGWLWP